MMGVMRLGLRGLGMGWWECRVVGGGGGVVWLRRYEGGVPFWGGF